MALQELWQVLAIIRPYIKVFPISALNITAIAVGEGCGGRNPCVTDNEASRGIPMYSNDRPVEAATVKINGTSITNPTL